MAVEADELYSNLSKLLQDICKFLNDGTTYDKFSPYARKQADELISRSKKQLQEIAKVAVDDDESYGAYVDMERKAVNSNKEDKNNIYSAVEEETVITPQSVARPHPNPYANLPAKDVCQDLKYGPLSWKCKIFLNFEKSKRVYGGLHNNWFLLYSSEKDMKPIQAFNLHFHKAQAVICKQSKSPPLDFELLSTTEGTSYNFIARTHKDMLQWISHINRCYDNLKKTTNLVATDDDVSETYDMIPEVNNQENADDEEEDIYHDIETYCPQVVTNDANKPPDLPARRCINIPLPPLPQRESTDNDNSSESSTYDPVITTSRASLESNSSFSEEEDDDIYEPFVSKPVEVKAVINKLEENQQKPNQSYIHRVYNNSNSNIEKPRTPVKPTVLPEKPRYVPSFKK